VGRLGGRRQRAGPDAHAKRGHRDAARRPEGQRPVDVRRRGRSAPHERPLEGAEPADPEAYWRLSGGLQPGRCRHRRRRHHHRGGRRRLRRRRRDRLEGGVVTIPLLAILARPLTASTLSEVAVLETATHGTVRTWAGFVRRKAKEDVMPSEISAPDCGADRLHRRGRRAGHGRRRPRLRLGDAPLRPVPLADRGGMRKLQLSLVKLTAVDVGEGSVHVAIVGAPTRRPPWSPSWRPTCPSAQTLVLTVVEPLK